MEVFIVWLIVWAIVGVGLYIAVSLASNTLFDTPIELLPWRVLAVSPFLAVAMVRWPLVFPDMFYNLVPLLGHLLLWTLAFVLAFRFPLGYGIGVAALSLLLLGPIASYTVASIQPEAAVESPAAPEGTGGGSAAPADAARTVDRGEPTHLLAGPPWHSFSPNRMAEIADLS